MDLADKVAAVLQASVLPSVIARGGEIRVLGVEDGTVTLEIGGSPGASLPLLGRIEAAGPQRRSGDRARAAGRTGRPIARAAFCRRPGRPRARGPGSRDQSRHRRPPRTGDRGRSRRRLGPLAARRRLPGLQPRRGDAPPGHRTAAAQARAGRRRPDGPHRSPGRAKIRSIRRPSDDRGQRKARPAAGAGDHLPRNGLRRCGPTTRARCRHRQRRSAAARRTAGRARGSRRSRRQRAKT